MAIYRDGQKYPPAAPVAAQAFAVTILVAASDSLHSAADLVCTGVNDHLVIQAALSYLIWDRRETPVASFKLSLDIGFALLKPLGLWKLEYKIARLAWRPLNEERVTSRGRLM